MTEKVHKKAKIVDFSEPNLCKLPKKNMDEKVPEKAKIGDFLKPILPQNEWQIRPLLEKLNHHGERLKVWEDVVETGENITAKVVQSKKLSPERTINADHTRACAQEERVRCRRVPLAANKITHAPARRCSSDRLDLRPAG